MSASKLDVACLSACGQLVLAFEETKKSASNTETQISTIDIQQMAGYMFSALAFSQWGVRRMPGTEPIFGLLIYPTKILRLSIWKPDNVPFGYRHKIECTDNPRMMGWLIETFMRKYKADFDRVQVLKLDFNVDPCTWTCMNFRLGTPLRHSSAINFGFLYRSNSDTLSQLISQVRQCDIELFLGVDLANMPKGDVLIVKYISALLAVPPLDYCFLIQSLLAAENRTAAQGDHVVHPYLAVIIIDEKHPLIVMRDMGSSLSDVMNDYSFQENWKSPCFRLRFYDDVAVSAINLVLTLKVCHNDIRPPNIAVKDDSFCLIDFDLARRAVPQLGSAKVLQPFMKKNTQSVRMMYTTAQIALVIFEVETHPSVKEMTDVVKYWMQNHPKGTKPDVSKFEVWTKSKGKLVEEVFSDSPPSLNGIDPGADYYFRILQAILDLNDERKTSI